jgi:serine/threonine protein kinase
METRGMMKHMHPRDLQPGQVVAGLRIIRRLDQGCFGLVFEAEEKTGHRLALKFSSHREVRDGAPWMVSHLDREMSCLLGLHHRYIVRVWGSGYWPGPDRSYRYMVQDLADGDMLDRWAERVHPTPHEMVVLLDQICSALEHMHGRKVVHRNLNSRNIVVGRSGHEPVLIDFSVGDYWPMEHLRNEELPPWAPRYPSPEAVLFWKLHRHNPHARYDFQETDEIYALGALLYDVLTQARSREAHGSEPRDNPLIVPASPLDVTQGRVPPALSDFTMKLMARDPRERPAHASELRRMLADLKKREGQMWHTPFHPAPDREPPAPTGAARMLAALARVAPRLRGRGRWPG